MEFLLAILGGGVIGAIFGVGVIGYFFAWLFDEALPAAAPYIFSFCWGIGSILLAIKGACEFYWNAHEEWRKKGKFLFMLIAGVFLYVFMPTRFCMTYLLRDYNLKAIIRLNNESEKETVECVRLRNSEDKEWYTVWPEPNVNDSTLKAQREQKSYQGIDLLYEIGYGGGNYKQFSLMIVTSTNSNKRKREFNKVYFENMYIFRNDMKYIDVAYDGEKITVGGEGITVSEEPIFSDGSPLKSSYMANYKIERWFLQRKKGICFLRSPIKAGGMSIFF